MFVLAVKDGKKIKEVGKPVKNINKLFILRGEAGQAIVEKDGDKYVPKYSWIESGLLWRPIKK